MNNFRLSTHNNKLDLVIPSYTDIDIETEVITFSGPDPDQDEVVSHQQKVKYLNLPALYIKNNEGQIINSLTKEIIRDNYVIEVIKLDNTLFIYPSIKDCALAYGISRSTIYLKLNNGEPFIDKEIKKFNKIRVFIP